MGSKSGLLDRVAVITGAASGLGLALTLRAARAGMKLALGDTDEYLLAVTLERVKARGVEVITVPTDVSDVDSVRALAELTEAQLGPPWLICNHSGLRPLPPNQPFTPDDLTRVVEANVWASISGVSVFAPGLTRRDSGHIVNIVSDMSTFGTPGAHYIATTHAVVGLSESLYRELDASGSQVGVSVVCPPLDSSHVARGRRSECATRSAKWKSACTPASPEEAPPSEEGALTEDVPSHLVVDRDLAEDIFAAVSARRFRVIPRVYPPTESPEDRSIVSLHGTPHRRN